VNINYYSSKSNKSLTFKFKLSAIIFNFEAVMSVFAISIKLIIEREMPLTPKSSCVKFFSCLFNFLMKLRLLTILLILLENNINQYFKEVTNVKPLATMLKS